MRFTEPWIIFFIGEGTRPPKKFVENRAGIHPIPLLDKPLSMRQGLDGRGAYELSRCFNEGSTKRTTKSTRSIVFALCMLPPPKERKSR